MSTKSTKRTTATKVTDVYGNVLRLGKTQMREFTPGSGRTDWRLAYAEIRRVVNGNEDAVLCTRPDGGYINSGYDQQTFRFGKAGIDSKHNPGFYQEFNLSADETLFSIGCHIFTLKSFNRILRAAGIRTTKNQTVKRFAAAA